MVSVPHCMRMHKQVVVHFAMCTSNRSLPQHSAVMSGHGWRNRMRLSVIELTTPNLQVVLIMTLYKSTWNMQVVPTMALFKDTWNMPVVLTMALYRDN